MNIFMRTLCVVIFSWFCVVGHAQSFEKTASGLKTVVNATDIELQFYNPSTVRVVKSPKGWKYNKESLSVIAKPESVKLSVSQKGDVITLKSKKLVVTLDVKSGIIHFFNAKHQALLSEKGAPVFTERDDAGVKAYTVGQSFLLDKEEPIYGLGQLQNGEMSLRGLIREDMIQGNKEDYLNVIQSIKGYGVFWDNYSPTTFKDNEQGTSFLSQVGDCVDYYFMYGCDADGVIAQMRHLTGQAPMSPLWTYGYWQSRERYKSQSEIVGVVKKYRELNVPLDGIIQDWQYWGNNYLWNAMDFLNVDFPSGKQMTDDIHKMNAHVIISIWSSFGPNTLQYKELDKKGLLFNFSTWPQAGPQKWPPLSKDYPSGVRVYDAYSPEARDLYWRYAKKGLFDAGIDGWWMDSTEPDQFDGKEVDWNHKTYLGSFRRVRNAYPLMSVGGVYQHQRATTSDKRVFILTRSAFAGQQRYGANTWSGDTQASWETLKKQITAGLNFSLCGIPYWNSDIGGFFLGRYKNLGDDYKELYVRWLQFGTFCPMMRSHGTDAPREIYRFGSKGEKYYDAIDKYINLRYSLLPYIYSTSWEVTNQQSSMMRALVMDFANDKKVWNMGDEYLFGKSLLVYPVTNPVQTANVYLPAGTDWWDFWTNEKKEGGQTVVRATPIDILPLYVKSGSILPIGPKVQYATEKPWSELEIRVYPGANGSFTLYEDEKDNYNYEKGAYSEIPFVWNDASKKLIIKARKGSFDGMLNNRIFTIVLPDGAKKTVAYQGKAVTVKF